MADMTREQVMYVAELARLEVTDEEADRFAKELDSIIHYAETLNELDTTGVEPTTHVLDLKNVMRDDTPQQWAHRKEALDQAPDKSMGQFRVPSILE